MPCWEVSIDWDIVLWLTGWNLRRPNAGCCTWYVIMQAQIYTGKGEQPCRKESGVAGWRQAQYEPVVCHGIEEGKIHPEVHQTHSIQPAGQKRWLSHGIQWAFVWLHLENCVQFWTPAFKKNMKILECIQRRASNLVTRLESRSYEDWLIILCLTSLKKGRQRVDSISLYSMLKKGTGEGSADLFLLVCSDRMCGNCSKLCQGRLDWSLGSISFQRGWWEPATGLLERWSKSVSVEEAFQQCL